MHTFAHHPDPTPPHKGERVAGPQGPEIGRGGPSHRGGGGEPPTAHASSHSSPSHPSPSHDFPLFNPPPNITDQILRDLGDPDTTYREVAEEHGQTAESLSAFLARPDIAERMRNVESGISQRARFVAIANLTTCAKAMQASVCEYLLAAKIREEEPTEEDIHPGPKHAELIRRQAETARKATLVLLRIAKFDPTPRPAPSGVPRLSEPGRCDCHCSKPTTPTPRPARTLESLLTNPPHKGEVPSLRGGGGEPPTAPESQHAEGPPRRTASMWPCGHVPYGNVPPPPPLHSEGVAVRSRAVEEGVSPTDTPGKPPSQSQSEGLLVPQHHEATHVPAASPWVPPRGGATPLVPPTDESPPPTQHTPQHPIPTDSS